MDILYISLFQHLTISAGYVPVAVRGSKAQELLCYLLLFRTRVHSREILAEQLWQEARPEQSRANLRRTLWQLRELIRNRCSMDPDLVLNVEQEWIQLAKGSQISLDVAELEQAYAAVQGLRGDSIDVVQADRLRRAVELYTGDLLEGWYQDWCVHERHRLQFMYLALLDKLIDYCVERGDTEAGIRYCLRAIEYDPTRERAHRRLMELYHLAGDRNAAITQFARCKEILKIELDVEPDPLTTETYLRIGGMCQGSITSVAERLQGYQTAIATLQRQIDQDIRRLNGMLNNAQSHTHGSKLPAGSVQGYTM